MSIPDYRHPPKNPAAAIAQTRNWFLLNLDGEPMCYRRKAIFMLVPATNTREFVGDDYEPMGNMLSADMPKSVKEVFTQAWAEHSKPPLFAGA